MANRADLDAAAQAGVISAEQAASLDTFLKGRGAAAAAAEATSGPAGEEELRFIRNFHDVFLALGILILAMGLAVAIGTSMAGRPEGVGALMVGVIGCALSAALFWGLGEVFSRRRRLFLPSIAICIAFTLYAAFALGGLYAQTQGAFFEGGARDWGEGVPLPLRAALVFFALAATAAAAGFYARFRLPFSLGVTGSMAALLLNALVLLAAPDVAMRSQPAIWLISGLFLFGLGVAFDARDPARATRLSDNGFWLHFAAAPLILTGAFGLVALAFVANAPAVGGSAGLILSASQDAPNAAPQAVVTLIVVGLLGLVSLLINRRALIVSALLTTGVAIGVLMNATGLGEGALIAGTLITLGGFVLILGAGWHVARRALLGWVKPDGVWARIFPPEANEKGQRG